MKFFIWRANKNKSSLNIYGQQMGELWFIIMPRWSRIMSGKQTVTKGFTTIIFILDTSNETNLGTLHPLAKVEVWVKGACARSKRLSRSSPCSTGISMTICHIHTWNEMTCSFIESHKHNSPVSCIHDNISTDKKEEKAFIIIKGYECHCKAYLSMNLKSWRRF